MEKYLAKNGYFDLSQDGTFVITERNQIVPWEYIYQNNDILLKVDQNGAVCCQAIPPSDIFLFKRDSNEKASKWLNFITCKEVNNGIPFTNFAYPDLNYGSQKPTSTKITFSPSKAEYEFTYNAMTVKTTLFVPRKGICVCMKTELINNIDSCLNVEVVSSLDPYNAEAIMMPWDKPEWYLSTTAESKGNKAIFRSKMFNSEGDKKKHRHISFSTDYSENDSYCISKEKFCGVGTLLNPDALRQESIFGVAKDEPFFSLPPHYATKQKRIIKAKSSLTFTQVLSMQVENFCEHTESEFNKLFDNNEAQRAHLENEKFFNELFNVRRIKTEDKMFDYYINSFLPLQMFWVASLDRGWPTGMRGSRDASNDFIAYSALDKDLSRKVIFELFSCLRSDGWLPRQVSTHGKNGKHDLRNYVDGGIVALEFVYEYISQTGDKSVLAESASYLDNDSEENLLSHIIKCGEFYINKENIGEHGLFKIYGGDWLDAVNKAGQKGKGESVTISCQCVFVLKLLAELIKYGEELGLIQKAKSEKIREKFYQASNSFKESLRKHAINEEGYFNGVYNDDGKWIFSLKDPDGEKRIYSVANIFALISRTASEELGEKVLLNLEKLKSDEGYLLFSPSFTKKIENVGRIASGDMPSGHMENGNVYNHGSQGFFLRALAYSKKPSKFLEVLQYLLPYNQDFHSTDKAVTSPYSVVNCYQRIPEFYGRGGMSFLTGTVAVALRSVYDFYFGIKPSVSGLSICPLINDKMDGASVKLTLRNKKISLTYHKGEKCLLLNGQIINDKKYNIVTNEEEYYIPEEKLAKTNDIEYFF